MNIKAYITNAKHKIISPKRMNCDTTIIMNIIGECNMNPEKKTQNKTSVGFILICLS